MPGFVGRLARVDLSESKVKEEDVEETFRKFLGGKGLAGKIMLEELDLKVDPLDAENKLLFLTGPLTGTAFPGGGKHQVLAKSPLTGIWGEATSGGYWGPELKFAGYDGLIIEGKASSPVYLWIHDRGAEIRDGTKLWGRNVVEATKQIQRETNRSAKVACIGVAGEKLVRYACVIHEMNHAAGRSGMGAVMGSKNLKAVAVLGSGRLEMADPHEFNRLLREAHAILEKSSTAKSLHRYGTSGGVLPLQELGILPTKHFQTGMFEGSERISGEAMAETILTGRTTCMGCPIACMRAVRVGSGPHKGVTEETGGPQYETVAAFGSLCLNADLGAIAKAHQMCNQYGLDTISTGNAIAFAMECYDRNLLGREEVNGMELKWGNAEAMLRTIEKIGERDGFGDLLAEGVARASKRIGGEAEKIAMHVKGMEVPLHEPRGKKGVGLFYAISCRGACHLQAAHDTVLGGERGIPEIGVEGRVDRFSVRGKGRLVKSTEDLAAVCNSAVICRFPTVLLNPTENISVTLITKMLSAATGWDMTPEELVRIGERAVNLTRVFNVKLGIDRKDDHLPARASEEMPEGTSKGQKISKEDLDTMLNEYYMERGWDERGIPTREKLEELGMSELAGTLPRH